MLLRALSGPRPRCRKRRISIFLYMGESKPPLSQEEEKALLYAWAYRAIGDAKLKKGHKPLSRKQLEEALGTPVSDTIWKFMQFPLQKKPFCTCGT